MNYRRAPTDVYDDPEAMQRWAALAVEAGGGGAAKKRSTKAPEAQLIGRRARRRPQMRRDLRALLDRAQEARLDPLARRLLIGIAQRQDQLRPTISGR